MKKQLKRRVRLTNNSYRTSNNEVRLKMTEHPYVVLNKFSKCVILSRRLGPSSVQLLHGSIE